MSWLNNSLNTIKGQLSNLAEEILAETAGPADDEYRGASVDRRTTLEILAATQTEKEKLDELCAAKDSEIAGLQQQIAEFLKNKSDAGGGGSGRSPKTTSGGDGGVAAPTLEDSWCWEQEQPDKPDRDDPTSSDASSSGNGNEMVNITLGEEPLSALARHRRDEERTAKMAQQERRIRELEEENRQLNAALEELDGQHTAAMQNVLELKADLQEQLSRTSRECATLKQEQTDRFVAGELEAGRLRAQLEALAEQHARLERESAAWQAQTARDGEELQRAAAKVADLEALLEKRALDNAELIERVKAASAEAERAGEERGALQQRCEQLEREAKERQASDDAPRKDRQKANENEKEKEKKESESESTGGEDSTGKHSEDEFIVVRDGDATSSGSTPPNKEELRDKIVELEQRVAELTLANGSLSLKLRDGAAERELAARVLKDSLDELQARYDEQQGHLDAAQSQLDDVQSQLAEQREQAKELKEMAAEAVILQGQLKILEEEKQQRTGEVDKLQAQLAAHGELEKRLLLSEGEKEALQVELQAARATQDRIDELEARLQRLTLENQQFKLNEEAETETLNNSAELEDKVRRLREDNDQLRLEIDTMTHSKFRQAIAEEKQTITDLDADEGDAAGAGGDEPFSMDKLRELIVAHVQGRADAIKVEPDASESETVERTYCALRDKLWKIGGLEKSVAQLSEELLDLQDGKMVWDHEKKTLEADISQYILQCDELMKNNEILLNELDNYKRNKLETISEHNEENIIQLESELEECTKLNRTLEAEYTELHEKIDELEREKAALTEELRAAQLAAKEVRGETDGDLQSRWMAVQREKEEMVQQLEALKGAAVVEKAAGEVEATAKEVEAADSAQKEAVHICTQLEMLIKEHNDLLAAFDEQKSALAAADRERAAAQQTAAEEAAHVAAINEQLRTARSDLERLQQFMAELRQELAAKDIVLEAHKIELQTKEALRVANASLEEKLQSLLAESASNEDIRVQRQQHIDSLEMQLAALRETLANKASTEAATASAAATARIAQLELELLATADLQKNVEALNFEKAEMIKALQQKHSENMQYYMEIQRLQPLAEAAEAAATAPAEPAAPQPCPHCPTLQANLAELLKEQEKQRDQINFLKEKADILTTNLLTEQTNQKLVQSEKADVLEQNANIRKDLERLRAHLLEIEEVHTQETMEMQRELEDTKAHMVALQKDVSKSSNAYTSASIRANQHAETLQAQYGLLVQQRDELAARLSAAEDRESKNQAALCNLQCALEQFQNDKENDIKTATQRIRKELQLEVQKETQRQQEIAALYQQLADANQGLRAASRISDQLEASQQTVAVLREEVESLKQQNTALEEKLNSSESSQTDKIEKSLIKSLLIGYVVSGHANDKHQVLRMISSVLDFSAGESEKVGLNRPPTTWLGSILGGGAHPNHNQGPHTRENLMQAFVQFLEQESQPKVDAQNMPNLLNISSAGSTGSQQSSGAGGMSPGGGGGGGGSSERRISQTSQSGGGGGGSFGALASSSSVGYSAAHTSTSTAAPLPVQPLMLNSNVLNEFAPSRNSSSILKDILSDS